jgi:ComF family protein
MRLFEQIIGVFFSTKCLGCSIENVRFGFCEACVTRLARRSGSRCTWCDRAFRHARRDHICGRCLRSRPDFERVYGLFEYAGPIGNALRTGKYTRLPDAISHVGDHCVRHLPTSILQDPPTVIIPIPIHWKRVFERGFDPPLILSSRVSKALNCPIEKHQLRRIRDTKEQTGLDEIGRKKNLRGAFRFRGNPLEDVLLIDDVYTTGATAREASRTLRKAGCKRIRILCAAYVDQKEVNSPIPDESIHRLTPSHTRRKAE